MQRAIKAKIQVPEGFLAFMEACSEVFNLHADWAFENRSCNKKQIHHALYFSLREKYPEIPTGLIQTIRDTALEAVKRNKFQRRPSKKPHSAIRYDLRTVYYKNNFLKLSWSGKRIKQTVILPAWFTMNHPGLEFQSATISYDHYQKQFYVNLTYRGETPKSILSSGEERIVGVDRGLYNIIALSDGSIVSARNIRKEKRKFLYVRRQLQTKVTPSAKRKLRQRSGKEKRFSLNQNHIISKQLVTMDYDVFVFEDLKGIRKQRRSKKINNWLSNWTFYDLECQVRYKAEALGKTLIKVDPRYTSQKCSDCGNIDKKSRKKDKYCCVQCGHAEHADINAAKNIKQVYLNSLLELVVEGSKKQALSIAQRFEEKKLQDNVSTEEVLKDSLPQMLDTSPCL